MLEAHRVLLDTLGPDHERTGRVVGYFVELYEAWHAVEPDQGFDEQAAEWREKLLPMLDPAATDDR